jgi:hypothetical protein
MTTVEILAAQRALELLYTSLKEKKLLTPEIKVVIHDQYNAYTKLKAQQGT